MNGLHILLVESDSGAAVEIEKAIKENGKHLLDVAYNGKEAVRLTEENVPDIIVIDTDLNGGLSGIETVRIINQRFHVPVVYITDKPYRSLWQRAMMTEHYGYLLRPFLNTDLHLAIERAVLEYREKHSINEHVPKNLLRRQNN